MKLIDRMAGIDTNLDDLQSGVEGCARAAQTLQGDLTVVDHRLSRLIEHADADLIGLLIRRAQDLHACTLDQSGALRELRENIASLRAELKVPGRPKTARRRIGPDDRRRKNKATAAESARSRD